MTHWSILLSPKSPLGRAMTDFYVALCAILTFKISFTYLEPFILGTAVVFVNHAML